MSCAARGALLHCAPAALRAAVAVRLFHHRHARQYNGVAEQVVKPRAGHLGKTLAYLLDRLGVGNADRARALHRDGLEVFRAHDRAEPHGGRTRHIRIDNAIARAVFAARADGKNAHIFAELIFQKLVGCKIPQAPELRLPPVSRHCRPRYGYALPRLPGPQR